MTRKRKGTGRGFRLGLAAGCTAVATFGVMSGAQALWAVNDAVAVPAILTGGVTFGAAPEGSTGLTYSPDGGAVTLTLPAAKIIEVLGQTQLDSPLVFWTFTTSGQADGITGLVYDVAMTAQVHADGSTFDLSSGVAQENTILHYSTLKMYPASTNGDCSSVPATPELVQGQAAKNVYVYELDTQGGYTLQGGTGVTGHVLQAAGAADAYKIPDRLTTQKWCVALDFNNDPDGLYVNDAQVTGTAEDGTVNGALTTWQAAVAFPPSLPSLGDYYNKVFVEGTAEDLTTSRAQDDWRASLYPDPSKEPAVTITLNPAVTNQNTGVVQPADHFELTGS